METDQTHKPWNKRELVGQKPPLKPKDIWAIRFHLQNEHQVRDLAMFNLAIDIKLRGCDLVSLRVRDVMHPDHILSRAMIVQQKTQRPVQFVNRADQVCRRCVDPEGEFKDGALFVPQSPGGITACLYTPVCTECASVGRRHRTRFDGLRDTQHAANQGDVDLQANQEPEGGPATAWPQQA